MPRYDELPSEDLDALVVYLRTLDGDPYEKAPKGSQPAPSASPAPSKGEGLPPPGDGPR